MLSRSDAAVAARDPALPGLALVLDAERVVASLRAALPEVGLLAATPTYLRYKPGTSCVAGFRVTRTDGEPIDLYAKAYRAAQYGEVHARVEVERAWGGAMPARVLLDTAMTVIRPLTNDRALKALRRLAEPQDQAELLRRLLGTRLSSGEEARLELLSYKPERRLVARLIRRGRPVAVLRAYDEADFGPALAGAAFGAAAGGPKLLGALAERRALATGWVRGGTLSLREDTGRADILCRVGATLARLHRLDVVHPMRRTRACEAQAVQQAAEAVRVLCPRLGARAGALARQVADALADAPMRACLVHGDFSPDQVVVDADAIVLIDWDNAASGDPAADLGSFIARIALDALGENPPPYDPDAAGAALCAGYAEASGALPPATMVQTVAGLLRLAPEPFRKRHPAWHERIAALLDRAEALHRGQRPASRVEGAMIAAAGDPRSGLADAGDPDRPLLEIALDREAMRPRLAEALGLHADRLECGPPCLRRHKPGRSALIAYPITPDSDAGIVVLGKLRAKGLDRRAHAVQQALRAGGFGPAARDGIMVPEPVGMLPEVHMWLQREVAGVPATSLFAPAADTASARRTAEALAKLHRAGVPAPRRWSRADEAALLRSRLHETAARHPALAETILGVLAGAERIAALLPDGTPAGIHRDFHPAQVLIDAARRVHLVDFDLYAEGDPALDAGNFLAHLAEQALRLHGDAAALRHHEEAFLARFLALSPAITREAVAAWTALSLARHIFLSTRYPDRMHLTGALVRICAAHVAEAERGLTRGTWIPGRADADA